MNQYSNMQTLSLSEMVTELVVNHADILAEHSITSLTPDSFIGYQNCDHMEIISWYLTGLNYPIDTVEDDNADIIMIQVKDFDNNMKYYVIQKQGQVRVGSI